TVMTNSGTLGFPPNSAGTYTYRGYSFNNGGTVTGTVDPLANVSQYGLYIANETSGSALTVTNNGTVSSTVFDGLGIQGNGGLVTYSGTGSASTTAIGSPGVFFSGLAIFNNSGSVNAGTAITPITGNFSGQTGIYIGIPAIGSHSSDEFDGNQTL